MASNSTQLGEEALEPSGAFLSAPKPPSMASADSQSVDELVGLLNRTPLFMTELDESDGAGGENTDLEALKALAYEGPKSEVAGNFKSQGNDCVKAKMWKDAREFYGKAIAVLKDQSRESQGSRQAAEAAFDLHLNDPQEVIDLDAEEEKEKAIEEACYVNRALCNLELQNYGSCNRDCASALSLNPRNVKAYYRSGRACLALDKLQAAADACKRALILEPANIAVKTLLTKIEYRGIALEKADREKMERIQTEQQKSKTMKKALQKRGILIRRTNDAPSTTEDAVMSLEDPMDENSTLSIPVLLLYPTAAQSDLIKAFLETETIADHLSYIFPCPWDEEAEFVLRNVDCYMETPNSGLVKVGKKVKLVAALDGGKVEVKDGIARVYVVPKKRANAWIEEFKRRQGSAT